MASASGASCATPGIAGRVYNIGCGHSTSLLDLVAALNRVLGTAIEPEFTPARAGDVRLSVADIARAQRELGYEPVVHFEEGLERTLAWMRTARGD